MHEDKKVKIDYLHKETIILVGNPNVGKSVIFNNLTGKYVTVSNYPGTTIDVTRGLLEHEGKDYVIIDTPGTNSLIPKSEDELVTRNILITENPQTLVQVADAKNLSRSLLLTFQLLSLNVPLILALNMSDEAKERGFHINASRLGQLLDLKVVETVAITGEGLNSLKENIFKAKTSGFHFSYSLEIEKVFAILENLLPPEIRNKRLLVLMLLNEDTTVTEFLPAETAAKLQQAARGIQKNFNRPLGIIILEELQKKVEEIIRECLHQHQAKRRSWQEKIGMMSLRPLTGLPIMFMVILVMYEFVGKLAAGTIVDFLKETFFGQWIMPAVKVIIIKFIPFSLLQDLLIGQYGLLSMALTYALAIILPIVGAFFIFFGLLEDSGYLPRLTVLSDRVFRVIGLNGKAILPMILGLGCGTMAVLTSRILDTRKERLLVALLLALGVPCSAQLGVVLGMLGGISGKALFIWLMSITISLVLVGFISDKVIPGRCSLFIQEIPPMRVPQLSNILVKTWARLRWYLREAVPLFMLGTFVLFILDKVRFLNFLENLGRPVVENLLGLPGKTVEAFLVGFFRRDYGAAGLYVMQKEGALNAHQVLVSMLVITLFVPCLAQALVTFKEFGWKKGLAMMIFVFTYAIFGGAILNYILSTGIIKI
ncbi:MAG: ferrous iron transport protein B [bacterium]